MKHHTAVLTPNLLFLPNPEVYPWRVMRVLDSGSQPVYFRISRNLDGTGANSPDDVEQLELLESLAEGSNAYELLAFTSVSNAETVGSLGVVPSFDWFDISVDVRDYWTTDITPVTDFSFHSYEFNHGSWATWNFWKGLKEETGFESTH